MDIEAYLDEVELAELLKKAHEGDAKARDAYEVLMREAKEGGDRYRLLYLFYLRERVLRELLEAYIEDKG